MTLLESRSFRKNVCRVEMLAVEGVLLQEPEFSLCGVSGRSIAVTFGGLASLLPELDELCTCGVRDQG